MLCGDSEAVVEAVIMENQKIIIKAKFAGDIRRITVDQGALTYKDLKKVLKKLFKPTSSSFNIGYYDEENDLINIRSDIDLQTALQCSKGNVLRVLIEAVEDSKSEAISLIDSALPISRTDNLFSDVEFTMKLEQFITQTVCSRPFINTLSEKLLPHLIEAMNNPQPPSQVNSAQEFDLSSLLIQSVPQLMTNSASSENLMSKLTEDNTIVTTPVGPERRVIPREIQFEEENREEDEESVDSEEQNEVASEELGTSVERTEEEAPKEEQHEERSSEEEIETFVPVNSNPIPNPKSPLSLRSVLNNLFKLSRRHNPQVDKQEEEDIPNLEETLNQLFEMGFTDRDTLVKTLKFHKQFQEGLNEVIEDLLLQREEEKTESEPAPINQ